MELMRRLTEVFFLYLQASNWYTGGFASKDCTVTVNQEPFIEGHLTKNVTINCTFTHAYCHSTPKVLWFKINTNQTTNLCSGACSRPTDIGSDLLLQSTLIMILTLYTICITILLVQTIRLMRQANSNHNHSRNDPNEEQKSRAFKDLALEFNKKYRNKKHATEVNEEKQETQLQGAQHDDSIYQNA
ncbi:uncharacterized protein si:ch211-139g16.8 isoform X2 [Stegostoma tigrinum]|uniref:uncharacterized protein si:ch211-139g16.8 isoform X2 n=1 Tax=Stegostoma tigrinum TaxID=3053191 RepID=UPI00202AE776|nr:uncharacterized protein si:ch211-139g16.8 isoform X2 [Stegostoma tigrinum]